MKEKYNVRSLQKYNDCLNDRTDSVFYKLTVAFVPKSLN
jgi:hypothetical protein